MLKFSTVKVTIEEASADRIGIELLAGNLHSGIAYQPPQPSELWFEQLHTEEMKLVVSVVHPLAHNKRVRMLELHRQNMVLLPKPFATRVMLEDCLRVAGAEPVVCAEMNAIAPMPGLVARTRLAAIIASNAIPRRDAKRAIPLGTTKAQMGHKRGAQKLTPRTLGATAVEHWQKGPGDGLHSVPISYVMGHSPQKRDMVRLAWLRRAEKLIDMFRCQALKAGADQHQSASSR